MNITYTKHGDYYYPDLALPPQPTGDIGRFRRMRKKYLKEHQPDTFALMLITRLIPELRQAVDDEKITAVTGATLSYLDENAQRMVFSSITEQKSYPTLDQACRLLMLYVNGKLTKESIDGIMMEESIANKKKALVAIMPFLPENLADSKIDDYIIEALKAYGNR